MVNDVSKYLARAVAKVGLENEASQSAVQVAEKKAEDAQVDLPKAVQNICQSADDLGIKVYPNINLFKKTNDPMPFEGTCEEICRRRRPSLKLDNNPAGSPYQEGIPLYNELKSQLFKVKINKRWHYLLAHCRANERFDVAKITRVCSVEKCVPVTPKEAKTKLEMEFAHINPLTNINLWQVFDEDLTRFYSRAHRMWTNAGHTDWSLEFDPREIIARLPSQTSHNDIYTASITVAGPSPILKKVDGALQNIGIITGNSSDTGIVFEKFLREAFLQLLHSDKVAVARKDKVKTVAIRTEGDLSTPCIVKDDDGQRGLSMYLEKNYKQVIANNLQAMSNMMATGCDIITLPCHTTDAFKDVFTGFCRQKSSGLVYYLSISDAVTNRLQQLVDEQEPGQRRRIMVLGGKYINDPKWGAYHTILKALADELEFVFPDIDEIQRLHQGMLEIKDGNASRTRNTIFNIITTHQANGALLLSTEFSEIGMHKDKRFRDSGIEVIDGLQAYANYVITEAAKR